ncbi:MAG TPA: hypothetical protein VE011_05145 [Candidatus Dormibacteraeota bacterium]|nr:hypothetical protein [Candidatus Dormibacteraeota bacterium]
MLGSVAEGAAGSRGLDVLFGWVDRLPALLIGGGLMAAALAAYWLPGSDRFYNHFVWQALAFLHGRAVIDYPVNAGGFPRGNDWMQDIYPLAQLTGDPTTTGGLLPFPPLPAIVLVPFVAMWGLATDIRAVSVLVGAIDVGVAWWALGRLPVSRRIRLATTVFFAFGTVLWYAAQLGTTWFFAHVVAVGFILGAVGVALGADRGADAEVDQLSPPRVLARSLADQLRRPLALLNRPQVIAGLLFGLACTARLSVLFGAPFFMLVGGGGTWVRRSVSAGLGTALPVGLLLLYNVATTGHVFHPGYDWQYQREANGYPTLDYHADWGIEDPRYLIQNLGIMFLSTPAIAPANDSAYITFGSQALCTGGDTERGLFDKQCPLAAPRQIGMSILLTSPAYLLAFFALRSRRSRLVAGSYLAVIAIAFINLMHFSQGWVQFGYRFSNDFVVFALPLVALGMARRGGVRWLGFGLVAASVAINLWGVIWGNILGW